MRGITGNARDVVDVPETQGEAERQGDAASSQNCKPRLFYPGAGGVLRVHHTGHVGASYWVRRSEFERYVDYVEGLHTIAISDV